MLARFGLQAFAAAQTALPLVVLMLLAYLLGRRFLPRYAVPLTLAASVVYVVVNGQFNAGALTLQWAVPVFTRARIQLQRLRQPGAAAVHRHHGLAKPAGRGGQSARPGTTCRSPGSSP